MDVLNQVNEFISKISTEYPSIHIDYEYDSDENEYIIWHNDSKLEYDDPKFKSFVAKAARDYLFNNNIYNFSFGYDYFKSLELEQKTKTYNAIFVKKVDKVDIEYYHKTSVKVTDYVYIMGSEFKENRFIGDFEINQVSGRTNRAIEYSMLNEESRDESTVYMGSFFKEAA